MVTIAFLGDLGSGKTTKAVRDAILTKQLHPIKKIYSNVHLNNYPYENLDLMKMYLDDDDVRDTIILGDEFYTTMDCRVSSSHRSLVESYFIAMTRKARADFYLTMQYEKFTDCRLAPFVKVRYIMEKIYYYKRIVLNGVQYTYKIPHPYMFKCTLYDERDDSNMIVKEFKFDGRRWFDEFNTDQYIKPPEDTMMRIKIKQMKDKIQYEKLKYQIENGIDYGKKKNKKED